VIRVLAGTISRTHPDVLAAHLKTMLWQRVPGAQIDLCYIDDNDDEASSELLRSEAARTIPAGERGDAEYSVDEGTHRWNELAFHRLAREKQRLLDLAVEERYDYVWLVDSDLLCGPDTLASLLAARKPLVSAVFWTRWEPTQPELPQVWQRHPYGFDAAGWTASEFLGAMRAHKLVKVRGLGACTLIDVGALRAGLGFWPLVPGLPSGGMWQGEDRHFCVRAERLHIDMFADAWPEVWHCYRPSQRAQIPEVLKHLARKAPAKRPDGTLVSLTIEPLEDARLAGHLEHVRGALGSLPVLAEIDEAARELAPGKSRIIRARFPDGAERALRIRLISARDGRTLGA
jgi:hypothetical protein